MALIYLIRHGLTSWNETNRLCGRSDIPLSRIGQKQAQLIGHRLKQLKIKKIITSPLLRALETAKIIGNKLMLKPIIDTRLIEMDYGLWEGKTYSEIMEDTFFKEWDKDPGSLSPPHGESGNNVTARILTLLDSLGSIPPEQNTVLVSHKTVCRLIICCVLNLPADKFRRKISQNNGAINIIQFVNTTWRILLLNDISHLHTFHKERLSQYEDF